MRGDVLLVGDHHDRPPGGVQVVEDLQDLALGGAVDVAGRLVGEDQRGIGDDRARDRDPLLLAAGELLRAVRGAVGEADGGERGERALPPLDPARRRA